MKKHEMAEKNQVKELSNVELLELSKEDMLSVSGGAVSYSRTTPVLPYTVKVTSYSVNGSGLDD